MNRILIGYWLIIDFKSRAPSSALLSASPVQTGIASSSHDHAGPAESDGTLRLKQIVRSNLFERSWGRWQEPLFSGLKKRGEKRRAKGLTWCHLCTTRSQAWALLMPRTAVRLVVPWPLRCSWTLWWWEGLQGGNTGSIHTLPGGTKQSNYLRAASSGYWRSAAAVCCGPYCPLLLCRTLLFELSLIHNISSTPCMCFSSALLNKVLSEMHRHTQAKLRLTMDFYNLWIFTYGSVDHIGLSERRRWEKDFIKGKGRQQK